MSQAPRRRGEAGVGGSDPAGGLDPKERRRMMLDRALLGASVVGIVAGTAAYLAGSHDAAHLLWAITTAIGIVPLAWETLVGLVKRETGVDLIALLAMVGALALGEYLAGAIIALMLASGQALESYADHRARRELSSLLARAPRTVNRYEGEDLVTVAIDVVEPGDRLLVKPGEVVPVDGRVDTGIAVLDESALTGESRTVERERGRPGAKRRAERRCGVRSRRRGDRGRQHLRRHRPPGPRVAIAEGSVRAAGRSVRWRWLMPLTLVAAGVAWALTGDAERALAVLVVATPCPLILAAPVAIVSGLSRAASRGIIVKGGGALETAGSRASPPVRQDRHPHGRAGPR